MSHYFVHIAIIGVTFSVACVAAKTPIHCGENEQLGNCSRICERKCSNPDLSECTETPSGRLDCQCKPGFLRNNESKLCVKPNQCPQVKCKKNEVLYPCGRSCEATCEYPSRPELCKQIKCASQGCQCDLSRGYIRDLETDKCVRNQDNQCCAAKLKCSPNSTPKLCGGVCEPTCNNPVQKQCRLNPKNCVINCHCSKDYVRDQFTKECVKRNQCLYQVSTVFSSDTSESTVFSSDSSESPDSSSDSSELPDSLFFVVL